jgi:hypothetical protein
MSDVKPLSGWEREKLSDPEGYKVKQKERANRYLEKCYADPVLYRRRLLSIRAWQKNHPDRIREYNRKYREKNPPTFDQKTYLRETLGQRRDNTMAKYFAYLQSTPEEGERSYQSSAEETV